MGSPGFQGCRAPDHRARGESSLPPVLPGRPRSWHVGKQAPLTVRTTGRRPKSPGSLNPGAQPPALLVRVEWDGAHHSPRCAP